MSLPTSLARAAGAVALVVAGAACTDKVAQPTAPKAALQPAAAVVVAAPLKAANGSTVCLAYMSRRAAAKVRYDKAATHAKALAAKKLAESADEAKARNEWKRKVDRYEAMMTDACR
jgi:hypothetical protein